MTNYDHIRRETALNTLAGQRNREANAVVELTAEIAALRAENDELKKDLEEALAKSSQGEATGSP